MNFKLSLITFFLFFMVITQVRADGMWYPGIGKLYDSDLVVEADYIRHTDDYFWIKVREVLRGETYSLKAGDVLRVKNTTNGSCGFSFSVASYKIARFHLTKIENGWNLLTNSSSSIDYMDVDSDSTRFYFSHSMYYFKTVDFNRYIKEFQECYEKYPDDWSFYPLVSNDILSEKSKSNPMILGFENDMRSVHQIGSMRNNVLSEDSEGLAYNVADRMSKRPVFDSDKDFSEMFSFIQSKIKEPIDDKIKPHTVIVRVLILSDGTVNRAEVVFSTNSEREKEALEIALSMPQWKAAVLNDSPVNSVFTFPVNFNSQRF